MMCVVVMAMWWAATVCKSPVFDTNIKTCTVQVLLLFALTLYGIFSESHWFFLVSLAWNSYYSALSVLSGASGISGEMLLMVVLKTLWELGIMIGCGFLLLEGVVFDQLNGSEGEVLFTESSYQFLVFSFALLGMSYPVGYWLFWAMGAKYNISIFVHAVGFMCSVTIYIMKVRFVGISHLMVSAYIVGTGMWGMLLYMGGLSYYWSKGDLKKAIGMFSVGSVVLTTSLAMMSPACVEVYFVNTALFKLFYFVVFSQGLESSSPVWVFVWGMLFFAAYNSGDKMKSISGYVEVPNPWDVVMTEVYPVLLGEGKTKIEMFFGVISIMGWDLVEGFMFGMILYLPLVFKQSSFWIGLVVGFSPGTLQVIYVMLEKVKKMPSSLFYTIVLPLMLLSLTAGGAQSVISFWVVMVMSVHAYSSGLYDVFVKTEENLHEVVFSVLTSGSEVLLAVVVGFKYCMEDFMKDVCLQMFSGGSCSGSICWSNEAVVLFLMGICVCFMWGTVGFCLVS